MGIYTEVDAPQDDLTVEGIAERVLLNKAAYELKFEKKKTSENEYYDNKKHVEEIVWDKIVLKLI